MRATRIFFTLCVVSACGTGKGADSSTVTGVPSAGTPAGTVGATPITGTPQTGTTGATPTGTTSGTTTPTVPVNRVLVSECDPTWCTFSAGGGTGGADLCTCVLDGVDHPDPLWGGTVEASCFTGSILPVGGDVTFHFDLDASGYIAYSVNPCVGEVGNTSVAAFDGDPLAGGVEVACVEDSLAEPTGCATLADSQTPGIAWPSDTPATGEVWVVVDEYNLDDVWDGVTTRTVTFELYTALGTCGNDVLEPGEQCDDGNLYTNDGCDDQCLREPVCGDGFVDAPESCDDGNTTDGDGCDSTCAIEIADRIDDCDSSWCVLTAAAGPNGGDLCRCTIPAIAHPQVDTVEASCHGGSAAPDVQLVFDMVAMGYGAYAVDTCTGATADSSVATFDGDPNAGGTELLCDEDSGPDWCSQVPASGGSAPVPVPSPASGVLWVVVDEWYPGDWWDGYTDRVIDVELAYVGYCGDGTVDFGENCDDGNTTDGDGCSGLCDFEPVEILDCDPGWCVLDPGNGPTGGDLCTCTIPASDHPQRDDVSPTCAATSGPEVVLSFDRGIYASLSATTCAGLTTEDSAVTLFGDDPRSGGAEAACSDDAAYEPSGCSKLWDPMGAGSSPDRVNFPAGGARVYLSIDDVGGGYWDRSTDRVIEVELSTSDAGVCGDGTVDPLERCDDGNTTSADGCSDGCIPEPPVIANCDPTWCALVSGAGPNGGDLCTCTIPASDHPVDDLIGDASCFGGQSGRDLLFHFDTGLGAYTQFTVDTCTSSAADSAIASYDADPRFGGVELDCSEDAAGYGSYCSRMRDDGTGLPPGPSTLPADLWIVVDEWDVGNYWNGNTDRVLEFEFLP